MSELGKKNAKITLYQQFVKIFISVALLTRNSELLTWNSITQY